MTESISTARMNIGPGLYVQLTWASIYLSLIIMIMYDFDPSLTHLLQVVRVETTMRMTSTMTHIHLSKSSLDKLKFCLRRPTFRLGILPHLALFL